MVFVRFGGFLLWSVGDYACLRQLLTSKDLTVQARACGMLGNLMRHSNGFYAILKKQEELLSCLLGCLASQDADIKKVSRVAVAQVVPHLSDLRRT